MPYNNIMSSYPQNMYYYSNPSYVRQNPQMVRPRPGMPGDRPFGGGFLLPFALGFVSSPLIFGATRPRPPYYGSYYPYY
ncbi:MAG: hypothetical protein ACI31R_02685 [Bacilli bacterium]